MVQAEQSARDLGLLAGIKCELDIARTGLVTKLVETDRGNSKFVSQTLDRQIANARE